MIKIFIESQLIIKVR